MANEIKYGTTKLTYTEESVVNVKVSDGTVLSFPNETKSTVTNAKVLAAYVKLKGQYTPHVVTPDPNPTTPSTDTRELVKMSIPSNKQINLGDIRDKRIVIAKGTLNYLSVGEAVNCSVELTGVDMPSGSIDIEYADGLEIFGATVHDQNYRVFGINGLSQKVWIHHFTFKNIGNYVITNYNQAYWKETDATTCKGWVIDNCTFENTSTTFVSDSSFDKTGVKNLMKDLTISNNTYINSPHIANSVSVGACDGYMIFGNKGNNLNSVNNDDNGQFKIIGTGSCFNNLLTNHEGYIIRAWPVSFGSAKKSYFYGNYAGNSRKYSAIEVQIPPYLEEYIKSNPKLVYFGSAKIYENTAFNMSSSKDWAGMMAVIYNIFAPVEFINNIGIQLFGAGQPESRVYYSWADEKLTPITASGNVYYSTKSEALKAIPSLSTLL